MFDGLGTGLAILLTPETLAIIFLGTTVGFIVSILPGLGSINAMALLLPATLAMSPPQAMAFLVTIMGASGFSGSITSILLNVPGDGTNAATTLDGYPMSQQGKAGEAIGAAAAASALGALFGVVILVVSLPVIRRVILSFGPPEMFALTLAAVAMVASVSKGNTMRGLISGVFGMALGFIGLSMVLGGTRFTFGAVALFEGIPLLPAIIGVFAIPEIFQLLRTERPISGSGMVVKGGVFKGVKAVLARPGLLMRSSAIGTAIGILPGVGGAVAPWVAYFAAKNTSKDPGKFGKGAIEGVIAPEASNDSKDGGALMPLLALGIPGSLTTAILLSAFMLHGVTPGRQIFQDNMPLVWVMLCALLFANLVTSGIGMAASNLLVKVTLIPATIVAPVVLSLALIGGYSDVLRFWGAALTLGFGFLGIIMVKANFPRPPFLVGFILLPIVERTFHQSLQIYRGTYGFLLRPITLTVIIVAVCAALLPPQIARLRKRRTTRVAAGGVRSTGAGDLDAMAPDDESTETLFVPTLLFLLGTLSMAGTFLWMLPDYSREARMMPLAVLVPLLVMSLYWLCVTLWRRLQSTTAAHLKAEKDVYDDRTVLLWLTSLPVLMWLLGMVWGILLYVPAVRLLFGRRTVTARRAIEGLAAGAVTAGLIYGLFVSLLDMRLFTGVLF